MPDDPSLDMTTGFTITAWVFLKSYTEWASVVTKGGIPSDENNYTLHQTGPAGGGDFGKLRFTSDLPDLPLYVESNTVIPLMEWHHVAMTYDGNRIRFYLDGKPDGGGIVGGPLTPNSDALVIGADFPGGDEFWHGAIDEVKIWNRKLRPWAIRVAMFLPASRYDRRLAGYWNFNEGNGNIAGDRSRNSNDGVLINGPLWIDPLDFCPESAEHTASLETH